jgi:NO-binding membrane sensor protein with MHYT domain
MGDVRHFDMGVWLLFLAFATSVVGTTIGLACAPHARRARTPRGRLGWLAIAALSIGGVGFWMTNFIALLGFATPGLPIRYDVPRTLLSAAVPVLVVFLGLLAYVDQPRWRVLATGAITGVAAVLMHYTGMWAVHIKGTFGYDAGLVVLSVLVAVGAAMAAFWLLDRLGPVAGVVLAFAVTAMHYTGMAALRITLHADAPDPAGVEVFSLLFPCSCSPRRHWRSRSSRC